MAGPTFGWSSARELIRLSAPEAVGAQDGELARGAASYLWADRSPPSQPDHGARIESYQTGRHVRLTGQYVSLPATSSQSRSRLWSRRIGPPDPPSLQTP